MGYSAVTLFDLQTFDVVSPAAPSVVTAVQRDNNNVDLSLLLPLVDADGSELTGLTKLTVATAAVVDAVNPFEGLSMPEILALGGVIFTDVTLTPSDAGTQKDVTLPVVNRGGFQTFAAAVSDE